MTTLDKLRLRIAELEAQVKYLNGDDDRELNACAARYNLTPTEARLFLILRSALGPLSRETLLIRLYANRSSKEIPDAKIIDVYACHLRPKIKADYVINNIHGFGYELRNAPHANL